jgi:hypothetical protein
VFPANTIFQVTNEKELLKGKKVLLGNHKNYVPFLGTASVIWSNSVIWYTYAIWSSTVIWSQAMISWIFKDHACALTWQLGYTAVLEKNSQTQVTTDHLTNTSQNSFVTDTGALFGYFTFILQRTSVHISKLHIIMFWNKTLKTTNEADSLMQHFCGTLLLVQNK